MELEAIFQFVADNPPSAMIIGGILLIVLSVFTAQVDPSTTGSLRSIAVLLVGLGFLLQVLWLIIRRR
jgi:hypothetical protein